MQLRDADLARLREQGWEEKLGEPVTVDFRGRTFLRQRDDGACIFWQADGRCRIHAEFGLEAKPLACQLFPFSFAPGAEGVRVGVNFACQSVLENRGAELGSHRAELRRLVASVGEAGEGEPLPILAGALRAEGREVEALERGLDRWLGRRDVPIAVRIDGFVWLAETLAKANFEKVRGARFEELLDALLGVLPGELDLAPFDPPHRGAWRLLRQAAFARIEDVRIGDALRRGRARSVLGQLWRSRRFAAGRGDMPHALAGWPARIPLVAVPEVRGADDSAAAAAIDDLLGRWLRATVLGGRAWGGGLYGGSSVAGLRGVALNLLATLWLARAHAAGSGRSALVAEDMRAALGRVDRHAGRAPWLGSSGERLRIGYLSATETWRGLARALAPVARPT